MSRTTRAIARLRDEAPFENSATERIWVATADLLQAIEDWRSDELDPDAVFAAHQALVGAITQ